MSIIIPEIIVLATAFAILIADLFMNERTRVYLAPAAVAGLLLALAVMVVHTPASGALIGGRFTMDAAGWWFKILFMISALIAVLLSMDTLDGRARVRVRGMGFRGEYYSILLFSVVGMMFLVSARDLATLFVSLELATLPLFVLAAWRRDDPKSGEAGLKYVVLGALASAFIVYGFGILYGLTQSTDLETIAQRLAGERAPAFWLAAALVLAGAGFKLTIVPFHMWAADVYQGAPTPVTAYLSVGSKAAGLAFAFQVFYRIFGDALPHWDMLIAIFAALTMTLGNLVAIVQHDIKRFMAFSAISQAGYFLLGFLGAAEEGVPAMLFYLLVYIFSNLAVFACIIWFENETGKGQIEDYRGLSLSNPLMALGMTLALFSLAGIPPLSGFVGKFFLFSIASKAGFHGLVAVAAVNSTISLYYYLRVVRQMYIEPVDERVPAPGSSVSIGLSLALLSVPVAILGILPTVYEGIHAATIAWLASMPQG
ncbi:MAG: NADH-quinone oxidoreductase subunit N [Candidatus Hydrogenedentes bacterium]|nr:NADH-quinone oxidoreductase subunit N [Candidatus Hydrogenedentota bacterium]